METEAAVECLSPDCHNHLHWVRCIKTVIEQEVEVLADGRWWHYKRWCNN
jgi:hypothetical protein